MEKEYDKHCDAHDRSSHVKGRQPQSSLRAEGEAIQGLQRRLDCCVGLWPPRNDRGAFGLRVQCSNRHCEPKAKQSSGCKEDWIASSAFGLLAMTVEPLASAQ